MEDGATEGPDVRPVVSHGRIIIIALTVSFLNIPHFLNGMSFTAALHDIEDDFFEWHGQRRMTQISYVVVGILAYMLFAFLFQRHRRKTCLYLVCVCQLTTSILLICSSSYWLLYVSRASSAISDIGAEMFCVIYISEIAPDEIRGGLVGIHKLLYGTAKLIPTGLYLMHVPLKPLPFSCISIVVSALVAILTYVVVPESPIYFLRRDDVTGAKESLMCLYGNETKISQVIVNRKKILKATRSDSQSTTSIFQDCINRRTMTFSCIVMSLYFLRNIEGVQTQRFEIHGTLWRLPKASEDTRWYTLLIIFFLIILGNLLALVLCDRVGRKILLLASSFSCSMSFIIIGILYYLRSIVDYSKWGPIIAVDVVISYVYVFSFDFGVSILPEVFLSDIFPSKILNTQAAMLGSFHLCVDYIVHFEVYNMVNPILEGLRLIWSIGGLSLLVTLFLIKFLSETKCRPPGFMFMDPEESILYSSLRNEEE